MSSKHHTLARYFPAIVTVVLLSLMGGGMYWVMKKIADKPGNPKKMVQQITVIAPPPPPPPEEKIEEPPPPDEEVELDEPEQAPEDMPETAADEPPPGADLGVDAEGGAGGDAFGLIGRKGGRSLLNGGGNAFAWYNNILQQDIAEKLSDRKKIRRSAYRVTLKLWIDTGSARVNRVELVNSTGDRELDKELKLAFADLGVVSEKPPLEMQQPIKLQINSRL